MFRVIFRSCQWYWWNGRILFCMCVDGWVLRWSTEIVLPCIVSWEATLGTQARFYVNFYLYYINSCLIITTFKSLILFSHPLLTLWLSVCLFLSPCRGYCGAVIRLISSKPLDRSIDRPIDQPTLQLFVAEKGGVNKGVLEKEEDDGHV